MSELTHFNEQGRAKMVDVTDKAITHRTAVAAGEIHMAPETLQKIKDGTMKKGDVLAVAQVAGIQAAKHNWELIPMCHPLPLTGIDITFALSDAPCMVEIRAAVTCTGVTGVEMEALTAVSVAASPSTICARPSRRTCASKTSACWKSPAARAETIGHFPKNKVLKGDRP